MPKHWFETVTGSLNDKRRWRAYKARKAALPDDYRTAIDGVERYLLHAGAISDGGVLMRMLEDLSDLFDAAAADGTAVRDIVGHDPVEFADTFLQNYRDGQWAAKERQRLIDAVDDAVGDEPAGGGA